MKVPPSKLHEKKNAGHLNIFLHILLNLKHVFWGAKDQEGNLCIISRTIFITLPDMYQGYLLDQSLSNFCFGL